MTCVARHRPHACSTPGACMAAAVAIPTEADRDRGERHRPHIVWPNDPKWGTA